MSKPAVKRKALAMFSEVAESRAEAKVNVPNWAKSITQYQAEWGVPSTVSEQAAKARTLVEGSSENKPSEWVRDPFMVRLSLVLDGFHLCFDELGDDVKSATAQRDKLLRRAPWAEEEARRIAGDAVREFLTTDNAVAMWIKGSVRANGAPAVTVIDTENVDSYSNGFAGEMLKVKVPKATGKVDGLDARWQAMLKSGGSLVLEPEKGDYFRVATLTKSGKGLARPSMMGLLDIVGLLELIALADHSGAWEHRTVIRHFTMGHEIKYGPRAGYADHFIQATWVKDLKAKLAKHNGGQMDLYTNFDWDVTYKFLEAKFFSKEKYEGGMLRLQHWWGAVAAMGSGDVGDGVWKRLDADIWSVRSIIGAMLESVFNAAEYWGTKLKGRIRVGWNPLTAMSAKHALELVRLGTSQGLMSAETARRALKLDPEIEARRMVSEREDMDRNTPYFEQKQGATTAAAAGDTSVGGRPPTQ